MSQIVLTEAELKLTMARIYKEELINSLKEKWSKFSDDEKKFVFEFYKATQPQSKLLSESKWYNWVGDIAGMIPGLELVNIVNGVSYWRQNEKFYALLSFIAGVPGLGFVLGPVKVLLKGGGMVGKLFGGALLAGNIGKMAKIAKGSKPLYFLVKTVGKWGGKLLGILGKLASRVPGLAGIIKGISKLIEYITGASKELTTTPKVTPKNVVTTPNLTPKQPTSSNGNDVVSNFIGSLFSK